MHKYRINVNPYLKVYKMTWLLNGLPIKDEDIPTKAIGFIYLIKTPDCRKYIGRKMLKASKTKTTKGVKKKIKVDSDWKDYWSSSPELKEMVTTQGTTGFTREIIYFAFSKGMLAYAEEKTLYSLGVLESDKWVNGNIRAKVFKNWVDTSTNQLLNDAIKRLQ